MAEGPVTRQCGEVAHVFPPYRARVDDVPAGTLVRCVRSEGHELPHFFRSVWDQPVECEREGDG